MTSMFGKPIDGTSDASLLEAFTESCAKHGFSPDSEDGLDLATILSHAFEGGVTSKDALIALIKSLTAK